MIKKYLSRLPLRLRRAFYALPLFVNWIIGIVWEEDQAAVRASARSMVLLFLFLAVCGLFYVALPFIHSFLGSYEWGAQYVLFVLHTLLVILYLGVSLFLAYREFKENSMPEMMLDRWAGRIERLAGR